MELLAFLGIPTAITGLLVWWLKRHIDKRDAKAEEREKNTEQLMLYIMKTSRATNILAEATAKAVQRIPDAHCNGDMTAALEQAAKIQNEEEQFLYGQGVKRIFGD
jgi:hypothetical protein